MNPINFDEIFNVKGSFADLNKIILLLDAMINKGIETGKAYEAAGAKIKDALLGVVESAKKINSSLSTDKTKDELYKLLQVIDDLTKKQEGLKKMFSEVGKAAEANFVQTQSLSNAQKEFVKQTENITKEKKKQKEVLEAETGSLKALQEEYKKQNDLLKTISQTINGQINPAFLKQQNITNEAKIAFEKLNLEFIENAKNAKKTAIANESVEGSLDSLRKKLAELQKFSATKLVVGTEEYERASKEVSDLTQKIKDLEASRNTFTRNVGNYPQQETALSGLRAGLSDVFELGGAAGVGFQVGTKAVDFAISKLQEFSQEIKETYDQLDLVQREFGKSVATDEAVSKIKAVSNVYKVEFNEVFEASKSIASSFNISIKDAAQSVNEALAGGANKDEVLQYYKEYSIQLKDAGFSLKDFAKLAQTSSKLGLFDDKAFDAIKEGKLRLGALTKEQEGLLKTLGKTGEAIIENYQKGDKRGAIVGLAKAISDVEKSGADATKIISAFGGPMEDLGSKGREALGSLNDLQEGLSEYQKESLKKVELEEKIANQTVEFVQKFALLGKSVSNTFDEVKLFLLTTLNDVIDYFQNLYDRVDAIFTEIGISGGLVQSVLSGLFTLIQKAIGYLVDSFVELQDSAVEFAQVTVATFKGLSAGFDEFQKQFAFIGDGINFVFEQIGNGIDVLQGLFTSAFNGISEIGTETSDFLSESFNEWFGFVFTSIDNIKQGFDFLFEYISGIGTKIFEGLGLDVLQEKLASVFGAGAKEYDASLKRMRDNAQKSKEIRVETSKEVEKENQKQAGVDAKAFEKNIKAKSDAAKKEIDNAKKVNDAKQKLNDAFLANELTKEQERINLLKEQGKVTEANYAQAILDEKKLSIEKAKAIKDLQEKSKVDLGEGKTVNVSKKEDLDAGIKEIEEIFASRSQIIQEKLIKETQAIQEQYQASVNDLQKQFFENQISDLELQLNNEEELIQESLDFRLFQLKNYEFAKQSLLDNQYELDKKAIDEKYKGTDEISEKARENELQKLEISYNKQVSLLKNELLEKEKNVRELFSKNELETKIANLDINILQTQKAVNENVLTEKEGAEKIKEIETQKTKIVLDSLKAKLTDTSLSAKERLEIEKQVAEAELSLSENAKEKRNDDLQKYKETFTKVFENVKNAIASRFEKENSLIDTQIDNRKTLLDSEIKLAEISGQQLDLADAQGDLLDAENRKIENQKRQQAVEEGLAFLDAMRSYIEQGDSGGQALLKASRDIAAAKVITSSFLGGFHDGGLLSEVIDSKAGGLTKGGEFDGFLAVLHGSEYVSPKKQVNQFPALFEALNEQRLYGGDLMIPIQHTELQKNEAKSPQSVVLSNEISLLRKDIREGFGNLQTTEISVDSFLNIQTAVKKANFKEVKKFIGGAM